MRWAKTGMEDRMNAGILSEGKYEVLDIDNIEKLRNKKIIIYGAGAYGNKLYTFLKRKGLNQYITSFLVSDKKANPHIIDGIPVKEITELEESLEEYTVLVAIGSVHSGEVISLLQDHIVKGLYCVTKKFIEKMEQKIFDEMKNFPLEQNKIFISCYEGMGYRCNCKYISEKLLQDRYPVKIVWAVKDTYGLDVPDQIKKVTLYTEEYYKELYTSKICITNNTNQLFGEKRNDQYYINTWHGFGPFKKVQASLSSNKKRRDEIKEVNSKYDLFLTGSTFYSQVYRESFFYEGEIYECGAPRNDVFFMNNTIKDSVYKKFGISSCKKIVLYAPTFRSDGEKSFDYYDLDMPDILKALNTGFGSEYVLMYRFHHHLYAMGKCQGYYEGGIDVTYYPDIQELLVAADVVITDYSSLMWDFSLQRKPVFLYQNDEEDYRDDRGFYCPVSQWPYPRAHSKEELITIIKNFDNEKYIHDLNAFLEKYGSCDDGRASERTAEKIMEIINGTP